LVALDVMKGTTYRSVCCTRSVRGHSADAAVWPLAQRSVNGTAWSLQVEAKYANCGHAQLGS
jgi:hypothetical protein